MQDYIEEGDRCPTCKEGHMIWPKVSQCYCHINPPCYNCENNLLTCDICGFEVED